MQRQVTWLSYRGWECIQSCYSCYNEVTDCAAWHCSFPITTVVRCQYIHKYVLYHKLPSFTLSCSRGSQVRLYCVNVMKKIIQTGDEVADSLAVCLSFYLIQTQICVLLISRDTYYDCLICSFYQNPQFLFSFLLHRRTPNLDSGRFKRKRNRFNHIGLITEQNVPQAPDWPHLWVPEALK